MKATHQQRVALGVKLNMLYTEWCVWYNTSPSPENYSQFIQDLTFEAK